MEVLQSHNLVVMLLLRTASHTIEEKGRKSARQRKSFAFTLAEVLVTLGIIGVVSAMTIPSLMNNYQRLQEAGLDRSVDKSYSFLKSYFKILTDCGDDYSPCMATDYKKMDGNSIRLDAVGGAHKCVVLGNGSGLCVYRGFGNVLIQIVTDINGQKAPNIAGRDLFIMYLYKNGMVDDLVTTCNESGSNCGIFDGAGSPPTREERENVFEKACKAGSTPENFHGCIGKILNDNWQMTY